jgi:hypothetical protein
MTISVGRVGMIPTSSVIINKYTNKERFWSKIEIKGPNDCWNWKALLTDSGHGRFRIEDKLFQAHRVAWKLVNGSIPKGMQILHKCDNPSCCNPDHLYCGTHTDNMRDRNTRHPVPPEFLGRGKCKLSAIQIAEIRELKIPTGSTSARDMYKYSTSTIATRYKVGRETIRKIWNSNTYLCEEGFYV